MGNKKLKESSNNLENKVEEVVKLAISCFDPSKQPYILVEEMAELTQVVMKHENRNKDNKQDIVEELTHVLISLLVVKAQYNIGDKEIIKEINKKLDKYNCLL